MKAATAPVEAMLNSAPLFALMFVIAIVPGIFEELAFRGVILTGLQKRLPTFVGNFCLCIFLRHHAWDITAVIKCIYYRAFVRVYRRPLWEFDSDDYYACVAQRHYGLGGSEVRVKNGCPRS